MSKGITVFERNSTRYAANLVRTVKLSAKMQNCVKN